MKNYQAEIVIMPHKELLDPQGKTVENNLKNLNLGGIQDVRIGKHITLSVSADNFETASEYVNQACKKILANQIMESYNFELTEV